MNPPPMASEGDATDDPRVVAALQQYMAELEAGTAPTRKEFLARHAEIAPELSSCLQGLAFLNRAVDQLDDPGSSASRGTPADRAAGSAVGRTLGDFQLVREIGRGGMGVVYEAIQLSLGRRVALKVLPFAAALDTRHLQRFRNEAQAAAQLHHTNIVPVYAIGCERSVHFYAMQLIEGQSLADAIHDLRVARATRVGGGTSWAGRGAAGEAVDDATILAKPGSGGSRGASGGSGASGSTGRSGGGKGGSSGASGASGRAVIRHAPGSSSSRYSENLSSLHAGKRSEFFRTVARLGMQAAEALDYAHSFGVVHRDIKPANLMVDGRGNVWITDFGLAQFYNNPDGNLTQTGDLLGTMRYMSPEQASGRGVLLDARSDVYSLGITLYELVTLERALPGVTREDLLRQIEQVEPAAPRGIDRSIPSELQTIILKAAAKDPADRYPSARALADDLQRFLLDQPIVARPPSLLEQARRWRRRHRAIAAAAVVVLVAAAIASTVSAVLIARAEARTRAAFVGEQRSARDAWKNARRAADNAKAAQQNAAEAQAQRASAEMSLRQARAAVDLLTQVAADELPPDPASNPARRHLLTVALKYYQQLLKDAGTSSASAEDLLAAQRRAAALLAQLVSSSASSRRRFETHLLRQPAVQADLHLSSLQRSAIAIAVPLNNRPDWQADAAGLGADVEDALAQPPTLSQAQLAAMLTPAQIDRLEQISRQLRGVAAFEDPDVQAALMLTSEQQTFIRKQKAIWVAATRDPAGGGPRGRPPPGTPAPDPPLPPDSPMGDFAGPPMDSANDGSPMRPPPANPWRRPPPAFGFDRASDGSMAASVRAIEAQLTPEQLQTWKTLVGPPFNREGGQFSEGIGPAPP